MGTDHPSRPGEVIDHSALFERLAELLLLDRKYNPSNYSVVLVSEGAMFDGGEMVFSDQTQDAYAPPHTHLYMTLYHTYTMS